MNCIFCARIESDDLFASNTFAAAFEDSYPLSEGHMLIVPVTHISNFFTLTYTEQHAMLDLVRVVQERQGYDEYTIGMNVGHSAGQTVWHCHLHMIPRSPGDVADPRGGVRWVIPDKAAYWND